MGFASAQPILRLLRAFACVGRISAAESPPAGRRVRENRALPRPARRMIDLDPGGAFELVFGQAIFIGIDGVLARLVIVARLHPRDLVVRFGSQISLTKV